MAVFAEVMALLVWALVFRRGNARVRHGQPLRFVAVAGAGLPFVILVAVYGVGLRDLAALGDGPGPDAPTVEVTGHKWWWEVRYPGVSVATANEIHIPVGQPVRVRLRTGDVMHSFWVPQLMRKTDLIPGRSTTPGCGPTRRHATAASAPSTAALQHAHMAFLVVADPPDRVRRLARRSSDAGRASPPHRRSRQGARSSRRRLQRLPRGRAAPAPAGRVGPDLTHLGQPGSTRRRRAAQHAGNLGGWIANSADHQAGQPMPPQPVDAARACTASSPTWEAGVAGRADVATIAAPPPGRVAGLASGGALWETKPGLRGWLSTVDHKGSAGATSSPPFVFFVLAGLRRC